MQKEDDMINLCIIGRSNVGKTSFLNRYFDEYYAEECVCNNAVNYKTKEISINPNKKFNIRMYDCTAKEIDKKMNNVKAILLIYDITNKRSFNYIDKTILPMIVNLIQKSICKLITVLVGNKVDKGLGREVSYEEGEKYASEHEMLFREISCKDNINIDELMEQVLYEIEYSIKKPLKFILKHKTHIRNDNCY